MKIYSLVDVSDDRNNCGILVCENENITRSDIQEKIYEIKENYDLEGIDWFISDVISRIPDSWKVKYYQPDNSINI